MSVALTRDPAAYRRARRDKAIQHHNEVTKCYEEYSPPQVARGHSMQHCTGHAPVSPKYVGRGKSCLTIFVGAEETYLAKAA